MTVTYSRIHYWLCINRNRRTDCPSVAPPSIDRDRTQTASTFQKSLDLAEAKRRQLHGLVGRQSLSGIRSGVAAEKRHSGAESLSGQAHDERDSAISNRISEPFLQPLNGY